MALAPLLYNITFDSQTRILYFWDKAGHEIYHCEIPSPAPALPTVQKTDTWEEGSYNWCYNSTQGSAGTTLVSIASNASSLLYFENGSPIPYDSTKAYGPIFWKSDNDTINNFGCVIVNDSGYLAIKNITSSTIAFQSCRCAVCSSNSVENITVYDSNNQPYFAWLFVSNEINYYFVLRTETEWTDDLSSIGYHCIIDYTAYFTTAGASGTGDTRIGGSFGDTEAPIYDASGNTFSFDLTKKYTISDAYDYSDESVDLSYGRIVDRNGIAMLLPGGIRFVFRMILTLSPQTVIDAYFTNQGSSATSDTYIGNSITYTLYDSSGNTIPYDPTKTYTTVAAFLVNGDTNSIADRFSQYASYSDSILKGRANGATYVYKLVIRVE